MVGWDFSQIPADGDLSGFNGKLSANYTEYTWETEVGSSAHPFGTLYFNGSHGSGSDTGIRGGANLNAGRNSVPHIADYYQGMSTLPDPIRYDNYAAQRAAGQAHAGPSGLAITQSTSITFAINETLEGYYNSEARMWNQMRSEGTDYYGYYFGGKSVGGRTKVTLQISHDGVFDESHLREDLPDWYDIIDNRDIITGALMFEDGEEREENHGGGLAGMLYSMGRAENPYYSTLYLRFNIELLDPTSSFILDNVSVEAHPPIPEPADFALYAGLLALTGLIARRRFLRQRASQGAFVEATIE